MEHRALASCVLIAFFLLSDVRESSQLTRDPPRARNNKQSEKTVLFPETNVTEHSLPVFPDPVVSYVGRQQPLAPPTDNFGHPLCAQKPGDTFCEKVENYPEQEIRKAINYSSEEFVELFGTMAISSRKSGDLDEDTVCKQQSRIFYPRAAVNENDQWAFVVNDVDYIQTVMAEVCENDEQPCRFLDGTLPWDVTSRCRQKFAYKRLLALHPNKKKTYTDAFRFPSCCICYVKKPFIMTRTRTIEVGDQTPAQTSNVRQRNPREP
ncbi:protein spaetzle-like isoform X1 [Argiope bruennichi]|uniref:Protein spaetzle like protein n=1 Tax=Argiope bruennichi TaxID=94029 RepID=A0A8T0FV20_ARGBR|nr:protein spaetzle-like isoform X1 [Argiope bruennichi]KAF8794954.1 Protein spaetzle like protein [Argiope bruennichi]